LQAHVAVLHAVRLSYRFGRLSSRNLRCLWLLKDSPATRCMAGKPCLTERFVSSHHQMIVVAKKVFNRTKLLIVSMWQNKLHNKLKDRHDLQVFQLLAERWNNIRILCWISKLCC